MIVCLFSVCLSVCLSLTDIVSKRLKKHKHRASSQRVDCHVSHTETVYKQDTVLTNYTIVRPLSVTVALCKKMALGLQLGLGLGLALHS